MAAECAAGGASQIFSGEAIDLTDDATGTFADLFGRGDDVKGWQRCIFLRARFVYDLS